MLSSSSVYLEYICILMQCCSHVVPFENMVTQMTRLLFSWPKLFLQCAAAAAEAVVR